MVLQVPSREGGFVEVTVPEGARVGSLLKVPNPNSKPAEPRVSQPTAENSNAKEPSVSISSLRREFGSHVAVDSVSFSLEEGEIFALLGHNGKPLRPIHV